MRAITVLWCGTVIKLHEVVLALNLRIRSLGLSTQIESMK